MGFCSHNPLVPGSSPGGPTRNENTNLRVGIFLSVTLSNARISLQPYLISRSNWGQRIRFYIVGFLINRTYLCYASTYSRYGAYSYASQTDGCLGQMTFTKAQAEAAGKLFELTDEEMAWLQIVPYKGSLPTAVPTDPLIYRWYEIVSVYGTTIKELIHEEFGDGIMSAIDFSMDIQREPDPKGDRVQVVLSGKYLSYKTY